MKNTCPIRSLLSLALLTIANIAAAQGTAFTYQGQLTQAGSAANGTYDFRFTLYASPSGGSAVSGAVTNAGSLVSNGVFTARLDFGGGVFSGPDRWLEVAVRTNGASAFTTLIPRQPVLPTPYSMHAGNADLLDGMNFTAFAQAAHTHAAGDVTSGLLGPARGGTGIDTSATPAGSLLRTTGTGAWSPLAPGANGQVLKITGGLPAWGADNDSGGTVTTVNTGTGLTGGPITTSGTLAIDTAIVPRLGVNNTFAGSNIFNGVVVATNASNSFAGTFNGNGGGISNLNASALSGPLPGGAIAGTYSNAVAFTNGANSFAGNGSGLTNVNASSLGGLGPEKFWQTTGNPGTSPNVNFLGTTDNQPLELRVNGQRVLRLEPTTNAPNVVGGFGGNQASPGVVGGTIGGGGSVNLNNRVTANFGSVLGGISNVASGVQASVSGGGHNYASGRSAAIGGGGGFDAFGGGPYPNLASGDWSVVAGGWNNTAAGYSSVIGGGGVNSVASNTSVSTISGGYFNTVHHDSSYATIGGGGGNVIQPNSFSSTIGGGYQNMIEPNAFNSAIGGGYTNVIGTNAPASTIAGGTFNLIGADAGISTIAGGTGNNINAAYGAIGGGYINRIETNAGFSVIAGGQENLIESFAGLSAIGGGWGNLIEAGADQSVIGGGNNSQISAGARESFIGGGFANMIGTNAGFSFIGAGTGNTIETASTWSTIAGGQDNAVASRYSIIGGGLNNTIAINGSSGTIAGGANNLLGTNAVGSTISGGTGNSIQTSAQFSFVGGGQANSIARGLSVIGGGIRNTNLADTSTIAGGAQNAIGLDASDSTIGGGILNAIQTNADWSTIAGGRSNTISTNTEAGTIAGGFANTLGELTRHATIGGGSFNTIATNAQGGAIAGGSGNYIDMNSTVGTIGGGSQNWIQTNAVGGTIGGGALNVVDGRYATVPGGRLNTASGTNAFAAGRRAKAVHSGAFVWADTTDADFASTATNQFSVRATGGIRLETSGGGATLDGFPLLSGTIGNAQLANNAVSTTKLADGAVTAAKIGGGQVVKSLNALKDDVTLLPGANMTIAPAGNSLILDSPTDWHVNGNAGTTAGTHFVGTTDNQPLEFKVSNIRALRLEPSGGAPNVIGGSPANAVDFGVRGAFIGGGEGNIGGANWSTVSGGVGNQATANYGSVGGGLNNRSIGPAATVAGGENNVSSDHAFVGGGEQNVSGGPYASVPGGRLNIAAGDYSFAAGRRAKAHHHGAFVWADSTDADFDSMADNQFLVRANFVGINRANPLSGAEYFGIRAPVTNSYGGMYIETAGTGLPFYGYFSSGSFGVAWTYLDGLDGNKWKLNVAGGDRVTVTTGGDVGIGTTSPSQRLHVIGNILASGTVTGSSDRNRKENLESLNSREVLDKVATLPISRWNYKDEKGVRHVGPMAQDFHAAFDVGADDKHISMVDADGVALAAIQGLNQKVEEQGAELKRKATEIAELKERLERLEKLLLTKNEP